jgi:hypothetical protein
MRSPIFVGVLISLLSSPISAGFVLDIQEIGSDVVATGSGTINTLDLFKTANPQGRNAEFSPSFWLITGPTVAVANDAYFGFVYAGPTSIGPGPGGEANAGSGDLVGISFNSNFIYLDPGYVSGSPLNSTATWTNRTFATLGLTQGSYVWTWEAGANADSYTLTIGAVPEPSGILLTCFALLSVFTQRKRSSL